MYFFYHCIFNWIWTQEYHTIFFLKLKKLVFFFFGICPCHKKNVIKGSIFFSCDRQRDYSRSVLIYFCQGPLLKKKKSGRNEREMSQINFVRYIQPSVISFRVASKKNHVKGQQKITLPPARVSFKGLWRFFFLEAILYKNSRLSTCCYT